MPTKVGAFILITAFFASGPVHARILAVPGDYAFVQAAINAAADGDTVLVNPGTYFENINFRGKNIVVASRYILTHDPAYISSTIINGSRPEFPDTGSCVLIISGEDSTAVLAGFTLTGGTGTRWPDKHIGGFYREGGGVLTENSSPTIRSNRIVFNAAINKQNVTSAGGGAIRSDDGTPRILGNIIASNRGLYGGGIVLNFSGGVIRNNIIYRNTGGEEFGGSGIWIYQNGPSPKVVENNTIVANESALDGGGVRIAQTTVSLRNNIVWGNTAATVGQQINFLGGASVNSPYNLVEGGWSGIGTLSVYPGFADSSFLLADDSPCIDAGDPDVAFNDQRDPLHPGQSLLPARGLLRNDLGAYGGPKGSAFPRVGESVLVLPARGIELDNVLPGGTGYGRLIIMNNGAATLLLSGTQILNTPPGELMVASNVDRVRPCAVDTLTLVWKPETQKVLDDTLMFFHNDVSTASPVRIHIRGLSKPTPNLYVPAGVVNWGSIDINIQRKDTSFCVSKRGTGPDSIDVSIDYVLRTPPAAMSVSPSLFTLHPPL